MKKFRAGAIFGFACGVIAGAGLFAILEGHVETKRGALR